MPHPAFEPLTFADLPGWHEDDMAGAFDAFRRSALHILNKPYRTGSLGVAFDAFAPAYAVARENRVSAKSSEARAFFETFFRPARVRPDNNASRGFVTGFYEPEAEASPHRTERFAVPLLFKPDDLVPVDDSNRPACLDRSFAWARRTRDGLEEYADRATIENGALTGQGLEIAWLADPVDAFFIHVQGAARLHMTDGTSRRITYAAKSGHPFSGPGRILAELGEIPLVDVTMQTIRAWFKTHPNRVDEILHRNRSYIFFREPAVDDETLGPIAAAKVPLTPGRSVAVDRLLYTFGTPIFIDAPDLHAFDQKPFRRLMIAQDTGSAILGAARGDLFAGSGERAGEIAGVIRHSADFYALLPHSLWEQAL